MSAAVRGSVSASIRHRDDVDPSEPRTDWRPGRDGRHQRLVGRLGHRELLERTTGSAVAERPARRSVSVDILSTAVRVGSSQHSQES